MPSTTTSGATAAARAKSTEQSYLLPETLALQDGLGPVVAAEPKPFLLTLGITSAIEQEQLDVTVWGSNDGKDWGDRPIAKFCHKSYCGFYKVPLDLTRRPGVSHLQVKWHMNRFGGDRTNPLFGFYVAMA